ncbi:hypothetical protein MRX96_023574 [Rhipicephalus microplus]
MAASKCNDAPSKYQNANGRIYSVFSIYGFITLNDDFLNDNVYFNRDAFEDGRYTDLLTSGLEIGDLVIVDFTRRPDTERYRALSVRRVGYVPQPRKAENIPPHFDNEEGVVCVLRDTHAFVTISRFRGLTASVQKGDLEEYMGRPVATLQDVLELGVKLRFDAMSNPDNRSKTKWIVKKVRSVEGVLPAASENAVPPGDSKPNSPAAGGSLVGRCGRVQEVFRDHAVVRYGAFRSDIAFMHASVVEKSLDVDIGDLREVLEEGGKVRFDAFDYGFDYGRRKWHVTRVELLGSSLCASLYSAPSSAVSVEALTMRQLFAEGFSTEAGDVHELCPEPRSRVEYSDVRSGRTDLTNTRSRRGVADERRRAPYLFNGGDDDEFPALPSRAQEKEGTPSMSIYENVAAVGARSAESAATCYVKQSGATKTVQFGTGCFYRDGEAVSGRLDRTLGEGDLLTVDYMVGTRCKGDDIVHCDLAWQGDKPQGVPRMSGEESMERLDVSGQLVESEDETFLDETIDDEELSSLLGESIGRDRDKQSSVNGTTQEDSSAEARRRSKGSVNGVNRTTIGGDKQYVITEDQGPAFARLILEQLEPARKLSEGRVVLRHASTQTEQWQCLCRCGFELESAGE